MNTQKLTTSFFGHKVEVTLVTADDDDKCYASIPNSVVDLFSERMECGEREGSFENLHRSVCHTVHIFCRIQSVFNYRLIQMFWQRTE